MLRNLFYLTLLSIIVLSTQTSWAAQTPVDIKADKMKYSQNRDTIVASGKVNVTLQDIQISANELILAIKDKTLWASGNVQIIQGSVQLNGQSCYYDLVSHNFYLQELETQANSHELKGPLFLKAQTLQGKITANMEGQNGDLTTCQDNHYHVEARRFVYTPEESVEGYDVQFKVGDTALLWTPYYRFGLDDAELNLPVPGQNDVEGWFLKTSHPYHWTNLVSGIAYLDLMEKKGIGLGLRNNYNLDTQNSGQAYIYNVQEKDTGISDWIWRLNHALKINADTVLNVKYDSTKMYLVPAGRLAYENYQLTLKNDNTQSNSRLQTDQRYNSLTQVKEQNYALEFNTKTADQQRLLYQYQFQDFSRDHFNEAQSLLYRRTIASGLDSSIRLNYYNNGNYVTTSDQKIFSAFSLVHSQSDLYHNLQLDIESFSDLDRELYQGDNNFSYLEKLPALQVNFQTYNLPWLNLDTSLGAGKYHEVQYLPGYSKVRDFTGERYWSSLRLFQSLNLGWGTRLNLSRQYEQYYYNTNDQQFVIDDQFDLSSSYDYVYNQLVLHSRFSAGNSPFYFDTRGNELNRLSNSLNFFKEGQLYWNFTSGYNFITKTYDDIATDLLINPDERASYRLKTGYNLENNANKFKDLYFITTLKPDDRTGIDISNVYDLNQGQLKSASSELIFGLGDDAKWEDVWNFKLKHSYEFSTARYILRELEIVKDLHCWTTTLRYDQFREEYLLMFSLKAWDKKPLRFYSGREGVRIETDEI